MLTDIGKAQKRKGTAEILKGIAVTILAIAGAMYIVSKIDKDALVRSAVVIGIMSLVIGAIAAFLIIVSSKFSGGGITLFNSGNSTMISLIGFAASILLLAVALKAISQLDLNDKTEVVIKRLIGILGVFALLMIISRVAGKSASKAGTMILKITISIFLIVRAIKAINELSEEEVSKASKVLKGVSIVYLALIAVSALSGKYSSKTGGMILSLIGSIWLLTKVIKSINELSEEQINKGLKFVRGISLIFIALIAVSKNASNAAKVGILFIGFTASLYLLVGAIKLINTLSKEEIDHAKGIIVGIGIVFAILMAVSKLAGNAASAAAVMVSFSLSLYILIGAIALINLFTEDELKKAGAVIGQIGILFGALIAITKLASNVKGTIISLTVAIAILVGGLALLTLMDQEKLRSAAISLGGVIVALGFALGMTSKLPSAGKSVAAILSMTVAIVAIGVMLKLMDNINGDNAIKNAESISLVLAAMGVVLKILSTIDKVSGESLLAMAALTLVVAGIGLVFFMLKKLDVQPSLEAAEALSVLLLAMSVSLVILSTIGATAGEAIAGAGALVAVVAIFIAAITALGVLFEEIDGLEQYLDKGGQILIKVGDILGQFIGSLLVGIAKPLMDYLPEMSEKLSQFMIRLVPFITISKLIDEDMFNRIKILTVSIIALTAAELIQGIADFLNIGRSLEDFGKDLGNFMINALPFFVALKLLGPEVLTSTKILAEAMIAITAAELVQGLTGFLSFGKSNLEKFSEQLPVLAEGINGFIAKLTDISAEKLEIVKTAVEAIKAIADLASYDLGTVASNISSFGEQLIIFGGRMGTFFATLSNIGLDTIQAGIDKVNNLVNLASNVASINVEQVSAFSNSLVEIATKGVIGFCDAFQNFEPKDKVRLATVAMIGAAIKGAEETLPNLVNKFKTACSDILTHISSQYEAMRGVGVYFTEGFKKGIEQGTGPVVEAARVMAQAAIDKVKETIDSNSPSKETMKLGNYFGSGFVIGIKDYFDKVYDTAYDSGNLAKEGLSNAISKISSIIEDGIDTNPTIRPVLDLSDVEAGASNLSSMLGTNSIGLNTNLNSISNSFDSKIQNRSGSDILSAIKNLETTILTKCGNTTNIYTQELDSAKLDQIVAHVNREFGIMY